MSKECKQSKQKNGKTVPILFTTDKILRYLTLRGGSLPLTEVCSALGVSRSTASRILLTLHQLGYLTKDPRKPVYALRYGTLLVNTIRQQQYEILVQAAQPHMDQLAQKLGETVKLSILDNSNYSVKVLCSAVGNNQMHIQVSAGAYFPLYAGAASKLLLAFDTAAWAKFRKNPPASLRPLTASTITEIAVLGEKLEQICAEGWAYDEQEYQEGIEAIACAIFSPEGSLLGALSIPHIASPAIRERIYTEKKAIQNCAAQIGRRYEKALI